VTGLAQAIQLFLSTHSVLSQTPVMSAASNCSAPAASAPAFNGTTTSSFQDFFLATILHFAPFLGECLQFGSARPYAEHTPSRTA
jgi:hypothetical protein